MNYFRIYENLIKRARGRVLETYSENHHIVPRCMGGSNKNENIVPLTAEEHYVAHQLLIKMYPNNEKLVHAANMMSWDKYGNRTNNKRYGWIKKRHRHNEKTKKMISQSLSGVPKTEEHKANMSKAHKTNGRTGWDRNKRPMPDEIRKRISETMTGKKRGPYRKKKT